jgi:hypothetical protein
VANVQHVVGMCDFFLPCESEQQNNATKTSIQGKVTKICLGTILQSSPRGARGNASVGGVVQHKDQGNARAHQKRTERIVRRDEEEN